MKIYSRSQKLTTIKIVAIGLLLLFVSRERPAKRLKDVQFIREKIVAFKGNSGYSANKIQNINDEDYVIEEKVFYSHQGKAIKIYHGGSEGFIVYSNPAVKNITLPFVPSMSNIKISVNTKEDYILDNSQKIETFEVHERERLIIGKEDNNKRTTFFMY